MMMGQVTGPTAVELAGFLGCVFFLVAGVNSVLKLVDRLKDKPPASEVAAQSAEKYTTKGEMKEHVIQDLQEHSNLWSKIGGLERGLRSDLQEVERRIVANNEEGRERMHQRINEVLAAVSEVRGEVKHITNRQGI